MIRSEHLGSATIPGDGGELRLYRHDRDFGFFVQGTELMTSRVHGSEEALAELALERIPSPTTAHVLVGGLGMGFTLARTLALTGPEARAHVIELVPEVVEWNRELLGHLTDHPLRDPRVSVDVGDVGAELRRAQSAYDAILLDVDNGPKGLTRDDNNRIYSRAGLSGARAALRPGGVLAVWSSSQDEAFKKRMHTCGFEVDEVRVKARRTKGPRRIIWLGRDPRRTAE